MKFGTSGFKKNGNTDLTQARAFGIERDIDFLVFRSGDRRGITTFSASQKLKDVQCCKVFCFVSSKGKRVRLHEKTGEFSEFSSSVNICYQTGIHIFILFQIQNDTN